MDYVMNALTGYMHLKAPETPEQRIAACEKEIAAALEKHGCILIVQVAAKEEPK